MGEHYATHFHTVSPSGYRVGNIGHGQTRILHTDALMYAYIWRCRNALCKGAFLQSACSSNRTTENTNTSLYTVYDLLAIH